MVEKIKDAEDRLLESMFASSPVADDGFSEAVVGKVRRRLWLRRVTLPTAAAIGAAFAVKPLTGLLNGLLSVASLMPTDLLPADLVGSAASSFSQLPTVFLGAALLAVCLLGARTLAD